MACSQVVEQPPTFLPPYSHLSYPFTGLASLYFGGPCANLSWWATNDKFDALFHNQPN